MSSMRTLNRRLLRWRRYTQRTSWSPRMSVPAARILIGRNPIAPGHQRAWDAVQAEHQRRDDLVARRYELALVWGPEDDYDQGCCLVGDEDHLGPCVRTCPACGGDGVCPDCGGQDDLGCDFCGGSGSCPEGCDHGQIVDL